jgi:hypothetical protein
MTDVSTEMSVLNHCQTSAIRVDLSNKSSSSSSSVNEPLSCPEVNV